MKQKQGKYGLQVQEVNIDLLNPSKWNPNVVSPDNEAKLRESLSRFGFFKPALVRELDDGSFEIVGGEHRILAAKSIGYTQVPVINLGNIDDKRAKELCLLDNGRYGNDDTLQLAELLEGLGTSAELASFMPYSDSDFASIFASTNIALDDLELPDDLSAPSIPAVKAPQTHAMMRFKVPVADVAAITEVIEAVMKRQRFIDEDSLTNAGNALVHIFSNAERQA